MKKIIFMFFLVALLFGESDTKSKFVFFSELDISIEKDTVLDDGLTFYEIDHLKYFDKNKEFISCILTSKKDVLENLMCTSKIGGQSYSGKVQGVITGEDTAYVGAPLVKMELINQIKMEGGR